MNVLGFDTSQATTSACVLRSDGEAFECWPRPGALAQRPAHGHELLLRCDELLGRARLKWSDLDRVVCGCGPGTFTGLRVGIATARALAQARGLELRAVDSLNALCSAIDSRLSLALIDAKRGQVFGSLHRDGSVLWPAFVTTPSELVASLEGGLANAVAAGDGALRFRQALEAAGVVVLEESSPVHVVRALEVCRLGAVLPSVSAQRLLPHYLRQPDAKPAR
jgi:tRNA threonylcarbamoyladenosine biosynthesis protein TsaB